MAIEPECQPLEDLLNAKKARLAKVEALLDDPEAACAEAGYTDDACILYLKSLGREAGQLRNEIPALKQELFDCDYQQITYEEEHGIQDG